MRLSRAALRRRLADESGAVLVLVAGALMAMVLLGVFVVDVGNWFVHKRHLQTQVDAAALAGAAAVRFPCDWATVQAVASQYGTGLNTQVGGTNRGTVSLRYNSATFASGTPPAADDTPAGSVCDTGVFDVKGTESSLPLFFGHAVPGLDVVPAINAHARVEIRTLDSMAGTLPLAVPDTHFRHAFAQFVLDGTTTPVPGCANDCVAELTKIGTEDGLTIWSRTTPFPVPVTTARISVRVGLVYGAEKTLDCSAAGVTCFDDVSFVRGYGATAQLRGVWLLPGTCAPDGYFATGGCSLGVRAVLNPLGHKTTVWATIAGSGTELLLQPEEASGSNPVEFSLASGLPESSAGTHAVTIHWGTCKDPSKLKHCTEDGSVDAQRSFLADDANPLRLVQVGEPPLSSGSNAFAIGTTPDLRVTIGAVNGLQAAAETSDPVVLLRLASGSGSQNQAVDCDRNVTFRDEIANGCTTPYQVNATGTCPNGDSPASCVPVETGDKRGQLRQGMNDRLGSCPVNHWRDGIEAVKPGDPRLVALLIVPYGSFESSGNGLVPILGFAYFYVTGWDGGSGCAQNDPYPGAGNGDIWGHFVKYIGQVPEGQPGEQLCDLQSGDPGVCTLEMTR